MAVKPNMVFEDVWGLPRPKTPLGWSDYVVVDKDDMKDSTTSKRIVKSTFHDIRVRASWLSPIPVKRGKFYYIVAKSDIRFNSRTRPPAMSVAKMIGGSHVVAKVLEGG